MSILINQETRVIVQGITGRDGSFHAQAMQDYGTQVVAGVTPGKGGQKMDDVPVFNTVADAVNIAGAKATIPVIKKVLKAFRNVMKRSYLSEESGSSMPLSSSGLLATMPATRPPNRQNPTTR